MSKSFQILIVCCAVFFCAASGHGQVDDCMRLFGWSSIQPQSPGEYKEQYDSLRLYIEKCAASDNNSWRVFTTMGGAVQAYSDDTTRFDIYRTWLISVLYLNKTNPMYFCVCMGQIASTFQNGKYNHTGYFAVLNYLRNNGCWSSGDSAEYIRDSTYWAKRGYDITHLPPLDSLGLGFLLTNSVSPSSGERTSKRYLASFTSSPNPFSSETKLRFELNRMSFVTIEVYDLLGSKVYSNAGRTYEAGSYEIDLDGKPLPHGTLYARISTGFGEVKTVKLVHE